jgi:hypothetical protein
MFEDRQFAVVTRVTPVREGGRIIVHAYGPYSRNDAASVARVLKNDAVRQGFADRSEVSTCKLQDSLENLP